MAQDKVLVVNGDSIMGLSVVRSLGRNGVVTHAACMSRRAGAIHSRYCSRILWLPKDRDALMETVIRHIQAERITHVMCTGEEQICQINAQRERLEQYAQLLFPPQHIFNRALYKDQTLEIARRCAIAVPVTIHPATLDDLPACAHLRFPVILKPRHRDSSFDGSNFIATLKSARADSYDELVQQMEKFSS